MTTVCQLNVYCMSICLFLAITEKPEDFGEELRDMARCIQDTCHLDHMTNRTTRELAVIHRDWIIHANRRSFNRLPNCSISMPYLLETKSSLKRYTAPILGYMCPAIVLFTLIVNTLFCIVLLQPRMRNPINIILVAMAICSLLTGLFPMPILVHFYAFKPASEWVPYHWCSAAEYLNGVLPSIAHTASIWLTTALAIVRYLCVCHSTRRPMWYRKRTAIYIIAAICLLAIMSHGWRLFGTYFVETRARSRTSKTRYVSACIRKKRAPFSNSKWDNFYYWYRCIFIGGLPCICLVVTSSLLIRTMKVAQSRRKKLTEVTCQRAEQRRRETNRTTVMLLVVLFLFEATQFPMFVVQTLLLLRKHFAIDVLQEFSRQASCSFLT